MTALMEPRAAGLLEDIPEGAYAVRPRYSADELLRMPRAERLRILGEIGRIAARDYLENPDLMDFDAFGEDDLLD